MESFYAIFQMSRLCSSGTAVHKTLEFNSGMLACGELQPQKWYGNETNNNMFFTFCPFHRRLLLCLHHDFDLHRRDLQSCLRGLHVHDL